MTAIINFNSISGVSTISANDKINVAEAFLEGNAVGLGTTDTTGRNAGLGTAVGTIIYNSTTGNVQVYKAVNGWQDITHSGDDPPAGHTATGGTISNYVDGDTRYRLHEFTASGTFVVSTVGNIESTVDFLVVAGGGGGGSDSGSGTGGGGGAGGYRTSAPEGPGGPSASAESGFPVSAVTYTVTVGAGGGVGANGSNSYFGPPSAPEGITSQGGGDGGDVPGGAAGNGGSGGGGGGPGGALGSGSRLTGTTTPAPNQGHDGAPGSPPAGGGGGAGGLGGVAGGSNGNGGIAKRTNISGPAFSIGFSAPPVDTPGDGYFAGGGSNAATAMGGGGAAGGSPGASGTANSGGGGGGGRGNTPGGSGGSGAVYIRYQVNPSQ